MPTNSRATGRPGAARWPGGGGFGLILAPLSTVAPGGNTAGELEATTILGGVVWSDIDHDGIRDPGEPLVSGCTVWLLSSTGGSLYGTLTQNDGHYSIEVPGPGSYRLEFEPQCYGLTARDQGGDDSLDSDANPSTRQTDLIVTPFTDIDVTRWSGGLVGVNGVNPPDRPVFILGARPDPPPVARMILDIEDPNDPASVTTYNVYRSTNAALPPDQWFQSTYDQLDEDQNTPGVQISDLELPPVGGVYYYRAAAYNFLCSIEGPR